MIRLMLTALGMDLSGFLASSPKAVAHSKPDQAEDRHHHAQADAGPGQLADIELRGVDREMMLAQHDEAQHQDQRHRGAFADQHHDRRELRHSSRRRTRRPRRRPRTADRARP